MYKLTTHNKRVEKKLKIYIKSRKDVIEKIQRLKQNPRKECGAHPLHGRLKGKYSCRIGSNIRMIYKINDFNKQIIIEAIGTHKIY